MDQFVLSQLFSSQGVSHAVFLAGLFAVVLFKKESIAIPGMFKLAYFLFAAAIVLPACITPFAAVMKGSFSGHMGARTFSDLDWTISLALNAAGPLLFALSILCAFGSLFPRKLPPPPPSAPVKHPLD